MGSKPKNGVLTVTNFEIFLISIEQALTSNNGTVRRPNYINISGAMSRDPEVKKHCQINQGRGKFMGIVIQVVPDVTPIYLTKEKSPK
jgi:hypothetical protein